MEDYGFRYSVSSAGDVVDNYSGEVLVPSIQKRYPYKTVYLIDQDGKKHRRLVHRIVATTFTDICGDINEVVNHLDEDKMNCEASNLQWTTNEANLRYGHAQEKALANHKLWQERMKERKAEEARPKPRPILVNY